MYFIADGELTSRGEFVSSYSKGDEVKVLKEEENLLQVVIMTGNSKGKAAYIDANLVSNKLFERYCSIDRFLGDEKRSDKQIRFKAKKNIYWEDWGHMRRVFIADRVYEGVLHSDGKITAYSPYFDVDDFVSADEIEIIN